MMWIYEEGSQVIRVKGKFGQWLQRFFYGRRGPDEFGRFLCIAALAFMVISWFFRGVVNRIMYTVGFALLVYSLYRLLSKNLYKRHQENIWYLKQKGAVLRWFRSLKDRWEQRKEYRFFRCPSCHALLRVPKNKGKLLLTCRKCGNRFERKT